MSLQDDQPNDAIRNPHPALLDAAASVDLGRLMYDWQRARATSPWLAWEQLSELQRRSYLISSATRAAQCWALEHPGAKTWPAIDEIIQAGFGSIDRWAAWP